MDVGEDVREDLVGFSLGDGEVINDDVGQLDLAHESLNLERLTP